jgi:hypothetical protein
MAASHEESATYWLLKGEQERGDLESRSAELARAAAQLERDRADFEKRSHKS